MPYVLDPDGSPTPIYMPDEQDEEWLTGLEAGYIGYSKPQVKVTKMTAIERLRALQGDYPESDNWAGSPEQAWA